MCYMTRVRHHTTKTPSRLSGGRWLFRFCVGLLTTAFLLSSLNMISSGLMYAVGIIVFLFAGYRILLLIKRELRDEGR